MKLAVIADIHGNTWALQAVLADIRARGISEVYDLGDSFYGPLDPQGTFQLLDENKIQSINGNQDRIILEYPAAGSINPTLKYVFQSLDAPAKKWIAELKMTRIIADTLFLCHGTPQNNNEYLIEQLYRGYVGIKSADALYPLVKPVKEKIIFCGHSHCPRLVEIRDKILINPGSIGLPAYSDDKPIPHRMETYSPKTRYCILELNPNCRIEQVALDYDYEAAARQAEKNHRPDWARWLRTGMA